MHRPFLLQLGNFFSFFVEQDVAFLKTAQLTFEICKLMLVFHHNEIVFVRQGRIWKADQIVSQIFFFLLLFDPSTLSLIMIHKVCDLKVLVLVDLRYQKDFSEFPI